MAKKDAKLSKNPMEAFRKQQKKIDTKKVRVDRHKAKLSKLSELQPDDLQQKVANVVVMR